MSAFKTLRDVSSNFEENLRRVSNELFTAKVDEPFEDVISKKLHDLSLYTSKLRLLQAKSLAASSQKTLTNEQTIADFTDLVTKKLLEQQVVKTISQSHHVKALILAPDSTLSPDMLERKEKISEQLMRFKDKELKLHQLDTTLKERQQYLDEVRREWDTQLGLLRQKRNDISDTSEEDRNNPLSKKLQRLEDKLSSLRALLARLASARGGGYDWLADPQRRLRALQLARQ